MSHSLLGNFFPLRRRYLVVRETLSSSSLIGSFFVSFSEDPDAVLEIPSI